MCCMGMQRHFLQCKRLLKQTAASTHRADKSTQLGAWQLGSISSTEVVGGHNRLHLHNKNCSHNAIAFCMCLSTITYFQNTHEPWILIYCLLYVDFPVWPVDSLLSAQDISDQLMFQRMRCCTEQDFKQDIASFQVVTVACSFGCKCPSIWRLWFLSLHVCVINSSSAPQNI